MKQNTSKIYTATKEINGTTYRAQFNGVREAVRATQQYKDEMSLDEYLLSNVIVEPPGLQMDDFEDLFEFRQVISFAANVMSGRFRGEEKSGADQSSS
jgi:hypothetical protein